MNHYFSENIRRLRKERDLTQEALADFLGVSFQAVSKWERCESYPDIELLPKIAAFFGVSTDRLLGVDQAKSEEEILAYIDKFDNGKYNSTDGTLAFMKEAFDRYPADFRILVRYMHALINDNIRSDDVLKNKKEILSVYDRIQGFCTSDRIRMYAKNLLIHYYRTLVTVKNGGVTEQDVMHLIDEMPEIPDSKEYLMSYMPLDPADVKKGCQKLFDSLLYYFDNAVSHYARSYFLDGREPTKQEILEAVEALELMVSIFDSVYTDGNYGACWKVAIYNYGYLGQYYHKLGDDAKALAHLRKCAELAKRFDTMPNLTERTALLFKGATLNKQEDVAVLLDTSLCRTMTHHMLDNYPLSEEFKAKPEFQEILRIMKQDPLI
ncbi:MAG: helix-turn-helix transcriptional regulator [Clostridia bacterium]|nr:helix-turn-helix transcriptional regulator [Clostridia bacterium]